MRQKKSEVNGKLTDDALKELKEYSIDINSILENLLSEGVDKFSASFDSLLGAIKNKAGQARHRV